MDRTSYLAVPELFWATSVTAHRCHPFGDCGLANTPHRKGNIKEINQSFSLKEAWLERSGRSADLSLLLCKFISATGISLYCLDRRGKTLRMLILMGTWSKDIYIFSSLMILFPLQFFNFTGSNTTRKGLHLGFRNPSYDFLQVSACC